MKELKKAAFWKSAVFGLNCIRQEYDVYEELARDRRFDMSKFLKKTVERFWKAAATGYSMDEQYILAIEESFFEPRDEWEKLALLIVQDLYDFFYALAEKNAQNAIDMKERQYVLIERFCSIDEVNTDAKILKANAAANHNAWEEELLAVPNKDKKKYLVKAQANELPGLLGEDFLSFRPDIKKEKPDKKKLPEIRLTSLDFDRDGKEWDNGWLLTADVKELALESGWPQNPHAHYGEFYDEEYLVESLEHFSLVCRIYADDVCVLAKDYDRVSEFWYMSALARLRTMQLYYEGGYPIKLSHIEHKLEYFQYGEVFMAMICAYAVGEDWIWRMLFSVAKRQYDKYVREGGTYLKNHAIVFEDVHALYHVLNGQDSELIRSNVAEWNANDGFKESIAAVLNKDVKELRKAVLKSVRNDRKMHDLNRTMTDPYAYACLRLAHERGLDVPPVKAVEVLESRLDFKPIDKDKCKIPFQGKVEAWLAEHIEDL